MAHPGCLPALLAMTALVLAAPALAQCSAESGARRIALLELYTSEGCDSCPPTDRWVSALPQRGLTPERLVTLAFHVDYWNYLGWSDPFARPEHTARQRAAASRNRARVVYTPQLLLDGADYRPGRLRDDLADRIAVINKDRPAAHIRLGLAAAPGATLKAEGTASIADAGRRENAQTWLALYENNLATDVRSGENRGKRLRHDFVVRALAGPFAMTPAGTAALAHRFALDGRWKPADLHVASFVQDARTGEVLQAIALRYCP